MLCGLRSKSRKNNEKSKYIATEYWRGDADKNSETQDAGKLENQSRNCGKKTREILGECRFFGKSTWQVNILPTPPFEK